MFTGNSKNLLVAKISDLKPELPVAPSYNSYLLKGNFYLSTTAGNKYVACSWYDAATWQTATVHYGSMWAGYTDSNGRANISIEGIASLNMTSDIYLVCEFYGNGSVNGGYISAQQVSSYYATKIGG